MHGPHTGPHRSRGLVSAGFYGVVLVSLPTLAQSVASGSLDACHEDGTLVAGWAKDDNYNGSIAVHFYVDGALVKALMADDYRSDVGNSSFEWIPPPFGAGDHTVSAYAIGVDAHGSPNGLNVELAHSPGSIDAGCAGLSGSAAEWCAGVPSYWESRQEDTVLVGNNLVRAGVDLSFGGTLFQLYSANWDENLILEHGGGAGQLSIWGYDNGGGDPGWFREPSNPGYPTDSCDPTAYEDEASCTDGGKYDCVARVSSQGAQVLDCVTEFPCSGWTAGAPWNPIQAQGINCSWSGQAPVESNWVIPGETFYTVLPTVWHYTSNLPAVALRMEQWTTVASETQPYVELSYRLTYAPGAGEVAQWDTTTQEIPAIFTAFGIASNLYWYGGSAPFTNDPNVTRAVGAPNSWVRLPNRASYPHGDDNVGYATESWWGVCDSENERCVTVACFDETCVEGSLSEGYSENGMGEGYITPIGYFGVSSDMDLQWKLYVFPYSYDAAVGPNGETVRSYIAELAAAKSASRK